MHDMDSFPKIPTTTTTPTTDLSRRTRSFCSTSTFTSSTSSASQSPSPSHPSPFTSPSPTIFSFIPFSWEEHPGIPKPAPTKSKSSPKSPATPVLPLPPPLRSNSGTFVSLRRKKRPDLADLGFVRDPFAIALMKCCKQEDVDHWEISTPSPAGTPASRSTMRRRPRRTGRGRFGFGLQSMDLYGSCKATCTVVDSAVYVPRSGRPLPAYDFVEPETTMSGSG